MAHPWQADRADWALRALAGQALRRRQSEPAATCAPTVLNRKVLEPGPHDWHAVDAGGMRPLAALLLGCGDRVRGDVSEDMQKQVEQALRQLTALEECVVRMRFGIGGGRQAVENVGRRLGVAEARLRRLEARALAKLRAIAAEGVSEQ